MLWVAAVKPVELTNARGELGRGIRGKHRDQRVARSEVNQRETDERHAQHDGQRVNQSSDEVGKQSELQSYCLERAALCPRGETPGGEAENAYWMLIGAMSMNQLRG